MMPNRNIIYYAKYNLKYGFTTERYSYNINHTNSSWGITLIDKKGECFSSFFVLDEIKYENDTFSIYSKKEMICLYKIIFLSIVLTLFTLALSVKIKVL